MKSINTFVHIADHEPDTKISTPEKTAKMLAYLGLFTFIFPPVGLIISIIARALCTKNTGERIKTIAKFGIVVNAAILFLYFFFVIFIKESGFA